MNNEKKAYEIPELDVVEFSVIDVITESNPWDMGEV